MAAILRRVAEVQKRRVTELLSAIRQGQRQAAGDLLPIVYEELRKLAHARMARERPGQTLQATALVHEAYMRLVGDSDARFENRAHFFGAAAEAMRRILVEQARRKASVRHGGGLQKTTLQEDSSAAEQGAIDILAVDEALGRLAEKDAQMAQVVTLRYFAGLEIDEVAAALEISPRTVDRAWTAARAWLQRELSAGDG
jgi:RNA polymerase sigma factor (TIGR02999 family)